MGGEPLEAWQIVGAVTLLLALSVLAIVARALRRYLLVGWFWFLGVLVPTIGLVQVGNQGLADRYTYVPAIGLFLAVSWAGSEWIISLQRRWTSESMNLWRASRAGAVNQTSVQLRTSDL